MTVPPKMAQILTMYVVYYYVHRNAQHILLIYPVMYIVQCITFIRIRSKKKDVFYVLYFSRRLDQKHSGVEGTESPMGRKAPICFRKNDVE